MKKQSREMLQSMRSADRDATFKTVDVLAAFKDAGVEVDLADNKQALVVRYQDQVGVIGYVDVTRQFCRKPLGLPMYNIFSAILR